MLQSWNALFNLFKDITLNDVPDALVWNYENKGTYSVRSFYKIVNFRGIILGKSPVIWKVKIPQECKFLFGFCATISCSPEIILVKDSI